MKAEGATENTMKEARQKKIFEPIATIKLAVSKKKKFLFLNSWMKKQYHT